MSCWLSYVVWISRRTCYFKKFFISVKNVPFLTQGTEWFLMNFDCHFVRIEIFWIALECEYTIAYDHPLKCPISIILSYI
jgi:hypothetical protein